MAIGEEETEEICSGSSANSLQACLGRRKRKNDMEKKKPAAAVGLPRLVSLLESFLNLRKWKRKNNAKILTPKFGIAIIKTEE